MARELASRAAGEAGPTLRTYDSVAELPPGAWDALGSCGHPVKSERALQELEALRPERPVAYAVDHEGDTPTGALFMSVDVVDAAFAMPGWAQRIVSAIRRAFPRFLELRIAMTGTSETSGRHWSCRDPRQAHALVRGLATRLRERAGRLDVVVVRDVVEGDPGQAALRAALAADGFRFARNLPLASVVLDGRTAAEHLARLKQRPRGVVRAMLRRAADRGLRVERVAAFERYLPEMYALYLQVHEHAKTLQLPPIPAEQFRRLAAAASASSASLVRDRGGRLVGFILNLAGREIACPVALGMDYEVSRESGLYYLLLWEAIEFGASSGAREVDLGITTYFVKQTMGAAVRATEMAVRFEHPWLRALLGPLVPLLFSAEQPAPRSAIRDEEDRGASRQGATRSVDHGRSTHG